MGANTMKPETVTGSDLKCGDLVRFKGKDVIISHIEPPLLENGTILIEFENGSSDCTQQNAEWLVYRKG